MNMVQSRGTIAYVGHKSDNRNTWYYLYQAVSWIHLGTCKTVFLVKTVTKSI